LNRQTIPVQAEANAAADPKPGGRSAGVALLLALAVIAASVAVGTLVAAAIERLAVWPPSASLLGPKATLAMAASQLAMIAGTLLVALGGGRSISETLSLGPPRGGVRDYAVALAFLLAWLGVANAVVHFGLGKDVMADLVAFIGFTDHALGWLALLTVAVGAPLSEELLFRGFLLPALARSALGFVGAALLTTVIWAALHAQYSWIGLVEVAAIGLLFAWMVRRSGSVRVPLFCHGVWNTALALLLISGWRPG
jgi:membrane protease YdiL (CAAX protease family)